MHKIIYELKTENGLHTHEFTVDKLDINDAKAHAELAHKDSLKHHKSGMGSVRVIDIKFIG